jgi:hypothetical protein
VIVLGLWSMSVGFQQTTCVEGRPLEAKLGFEDAGLALFQCYDKYLDGFGWRPLSTEWDYPATLERVRQEVFSDELRHIDAAG